MDADQYDEAPGHVLTSMVKGVDAVVFDQISRVRAGTFRGGIYEYGLAENGVKWVYDENNRKWITEQIKSRVDALQADILSGKIVVPTK